MYKPLIEIILDKDFIRYYGNVYTSKTHIQTDRQTLTTDSQTPPDTTRLTALSLCMGTCWVCPVVISDCCLVAAVVWSSDEVSS